MRLAAIMVSGIMAVGPSTVTTAAGPDLAAQSQVVARRVPASGVQPRAAVSADGVTHMVFLAGSPAASDVMYTSILAPGGEPTEPVRIGPPGSAVALGGIRGPQIALGGGRIHIVWNGTGQREGQPAGRESGPLWYSTSDDGGASFAMPRDLMGSTWALDGGAAVAAEGDSVRIVWHAAWRDGALDEAARALFVASSVDGGLTFGAEQRIEQSGTGACACCALHACIDPRGRLAIVYRAAAGNADRDLRLLTQGADGSAYWATPIDPWRVDSCPVTTSTCVLAGHRLLLAWETRGQVWVGELDQASGALARRASAPGGGEGLRKYPAIAVDDAGRVLLSWAQVPTLGAAGEVHWQLFGADLEPVAGSAGAFADLPAWASPCVVTGPDGFVVWY
jgi:hypothetical protein